MQDGQTNRRACTSIATAEAIEEAEVEVSQSTTPKLGSPNPEGVIPVPMIMLERSITAGNAGENIVSGSAFEFARRRQIVSFGVGQSATGMFSTLQAGADVIAEEFSPPILTRYPIVPDEMYFTDVMEAGDRLVIRFRNPTGGALTARAVVQLSDVA